jgi:hypothetical protein
MGIACAIVTMAQAIAVAVTWRYPGSYLAGRRPESGSGARRD